MQPDPDGLNLADPNLGQQLLKDPMTLPLDVFELYVAQRRKKPTSSHVVDDWLRDADWPLMHQFAPLDPQDAVDKIDPLVSKIVSYLHRPHGPAIRRALKVAVEAQDILSRTVSAYRPGAGRKVEMRLDAVRAYVIRKFNQHPTKPGESAVSWAKLADLVFVRDGHCQRRTAEKDKSKCGVSKHQYNSPCVKALQTAVQRLLTAMKNDGIPT